MQSVSVIIPTRNRCDSLRELLDSIIPQLGTLDELVIVDNNSSDDTKKTVSYISKSNKTLRVRYLLEEKVGYVFPYNAGLKSALNSWVIVVDDDCVVDPDWLSGVKECIRKEKPDVILGSSQTYYANNLYSLTMYLFDFDWKSQYIEKKKILDGQILDSKNIAYNKRFLDKNKLSYDLTVIAAQDYDLGTEIIQNGGKGVFCPDMIVAHKDPTDFISFFKKRFRAYAAFLWVSEHRNEVMTHNRKQKFSNSLNKVITKYDIKGLQKVLFTCFAYFVLIVNLVLDYLLKVKIIKSIFIRTFTN